MIIIALNEYIAQTTL